ncbi:hypothetical protein NUSPORA_02739 [Nucleospora cyclopteri]
MRMNKYVFKEKLGRGSHGTTYLLKVKGEQKYVVCKSIPSKNGKHAKREISVLKKCNHKRIVKMIAQHNVDSGIYLILEYANYGTLDTMIKFFIKNNMFASTNLIWSVAAQISDALSYLHSKNIVHRDIKPANILINRFSLRKNEYLEFKICDFSLSIETDSNIVDKNIVGTPYYMAPEIVSKKPYDFTVDVWALGVILYELCFNKKPFNGESRELLYKSIKNDTLNIFYEPDPDLAHFIKRCLERKDRISAKELTRNDKSRINLSRIDLKNSELQIAKLEEKIRQISSSQIKE